MPVKNYFVYILTNKYNKVLYTGVTSDLVRRVYEHKEKLVEGFTAKYNLNKLVYFEIFGSAEEAISREKQLKAGNRIAKLKLVTQSNPTFSDLFQTLL